jgi:uncharacterized membrane protein
MSSSRTPVRSPILLIVLIGGLVGGFVVYVLNLSRHVASAPSAQDRWTHDQLPCLLCVGWIAVVMLWWLWSLILGRRSTADESPVEAGRATWQRILLGPTAAMGPFLLWRAWAMVGRLANGQWQGSDWATLALWAMFVIPWIVRPSTEELYVLGTGDGSRVKDERWQQVTGKAANLTIVIFVWVLLIGGALYETMVLRTEPVLTIAMLLILMLILAITNAYWSRRL